MYVMQQTHKLIVMRHAKAGELPGGPDFERPLKPRGRRDSAAAGEWLASHGFRPDAVICSAATRTRETWQYLSPSLGGDPEFFAERRLYGADADDIADAMRQTESDVGTLMYIGHNPAAAELVALLTKDEPDFPTSAIAVIGLPGSWAELSAGEGETLATWTPRGSSNA
jgi:phosphohistidine phosphatase